MTYEPDQLEMQLRVLGRQLGNDAPGVALMECVRHNARTVIAERAAGQALQARRRKLVGLYCLLLATLPLPLLFVWMDWSAVSSVFGAMLPPSASAIVSGVYLWLKVTALVLIYAIGLCAMVTMALCMRSSEDFAGTESVPA
ncbi:MAG: hypothetical protein ACR2IE_10110 [Candidatus Sumerlaeaceae bacterium]